MEGRERGRLIGGVAHRSPARFESEVRRSGAVVLPHGGRGVKGLPALADRLHRWQDRLGALAPVCCVVCVCRGQERGFCWFTTLAGELAFNRAVVEMLKELIGSIRRFQVCVSCHLFGDGRGRIQSRSLVGLVNGLPVCSRRQRVGDVVGPVAGDAFYWGPVFLMCDGFRVELRLSGVFPTRARFLELVYIPRLEILCDIRAGNRM